MRAREGVRRALMTACLLAGIALLLYPVVGTYLNERSFNDAVSHYEEAVRTLPDDERERMLAEARAYNDSLRGDPVRDPFVPNSGYAVPGNYDDVLDVDGTGLMGTVSIPSIGLALPVYHGTSDDVLAHGAGHIPQTSLPVGGAGTHAVLTGHTGLPTARLFTDLERLKEGDVFVIEVLGERRAYAVDDVRVVEPDDVSSIRVDGEREYVTLLTCTPYGVNSHRLLVRGAPCELPDDEVLAPAAPVPWPLVGALAAAAALAAVLAVRAIRRRRRARTPGGGS
ncbi:class C sortase [Gordonibacter pamelaeae]